MDEAVRHMLKQMRAEAPDRHTATLFDYVVDRLEDIERLTRHVSRMERMLRRIMHTSRSILRDEGELLMAGPKTQEVIEQLVTESAANTSATNSALNLLHTLIGQVEANVDDPTALQAVLDTFKANDQALAAGVTNGTVAAPDPIGTPTPVAPQQENPDDAPHDPLAPEGPSVTAPTDDGSSSNPNAVAAARHKPNNRKK
jgi:hypothetical protein